MHIILATLTLTLALMLWPSSGIPATASMKRLQDATEASLQRSGKKITPSQSTSRKQVRG